MWEPQFWLSRDGRVLLQAPLDKPYCCVTRLTCPRAPEAGESVVHLVTPGDGKVVTTDVIARRLSAESLVAPDGSPVGPERTFPILTPPAVDAMRLLLSAKCDGSAASLMGATEEGQRLVRFLGRITGAPLFAHTIGEATKVQDVIGISHNPNTLARSSLIAAMREGAVFLVNAKQPSKPNLDVMRGVAEFVEKVRSGKASSVAATLGDSFRVHENFVLVFNYPRGAAELKPLSPCAMYYAPMNRNSVFGQDETLGYQNVASGPNTALVLMMFNIPAYEQWFEAVIRPTAEKHGQCVRITKNLEEWRTEMRRVALEADMVLVDLSHPPGAGLSPNVIWELSEIQHACFNKELSRNRLLCFARGLEHVKAREERPDFIYSSDIDPAWVPVKERGDAEELLGLRIRRYDPDNPESVESFTAWLDEHLETFVQGVPPPRARSPILAEARRVLAIPRTDGKLGAEDIDGLWLRAIADLDFGLLKKLVGGERPSQGVFDLTGEFVACVSITRTTETNGYWTVAKAVIGRSRALREHYFNLLATEHLRRDTRWTNNFRENLWFALRVANLSPSELQRARQLLELERDHGTRGVAESVLTQYLPPSEREAAEIKLIETAWGRAASVEHAAPRTVVGGGALKPSTSARGRGSMVLFALVMTALAASGLYWAFLNW
jgi:hypothetical protein